MDKKYYNNLAVASAPHLVSAMDTSKTMMMVIIALMPSLLVSTYVFGFRCIILPAVCVAASMGFEWLYNKMTGKKQTVGDMSAASSQMSDSLNGKNDPEGAARTRALYIVRVVSFTIDPLAANGAKSCVPIIA